MANHVYFNISVDGLNPECKALEQCISLVGFYNVETVRA